MMCYNIKVYTQLDDSIRFNSTVQFNSTIEFDSRIAQGARHGNVSLAAYSQRYARLVHRFNSKHRVECSH